MERYDISLKQHVPTLIVALIFLCLVIVGGVTYNAIVLNRLEQSVAQIKKSVTQNAYCLHQTDSDVQNTEVGVQALQAQLQLSPNVQPLIPCGP
jgi:hypothetical protein